MDQANLDEVREETEWEQCSRNPDVARFVKTRNLVERNRLQSLRSQLDKQLEWELKRLSLERREFADVLENLRKRHEKVDRRNVRTLKNNLNSNFYICERNRKHDRYLNSMNMNDILPKGLFNCTTTNNISSTNSSSLSIPKVISSPDITKLLNTRSNNNNNNNTSKHLNPIPTIHTETSNSTEKVSKPNIYHLFYTDSGEWIHLNKLNLNISAPSSASKSSASSKGMKCTKSWSENE
ncbi:unnamed protein product [Schistosoma bovis]|uniref:Uncharacterized protein n=1 Tax=Schistosoma bovis TaxID=6184 RepID=A0A430Q465_SCHBO|nr:uncharacterized protein DC041_0011968 [Schistosoma bovis]CAH8465013.1 unnamed protein product [Schistosoma intercalatum]RTG82491.1 uncharacterized protein DC041_0011969 [Schistosoma bovis]CAH8454992.1 unnamed protein product [Schistosoma bovis]CAH8455494.1 unnamed protein product [Schistosoma bovis]